MNDNFSAYFCKIVAYLKMADYRYLMQSPDGKHEIWRYYSTFISVPRQCKSRHTANAIMKAAKFPYEF